MDSIMSVFRCCNQKDEDKDKENSLCLELNNNSCNCRAAPLYSISASTATSPDAIPPKANFDFKLYTIGLNPTSSNAANPSISNEFCDLEEANPSKSCKSLCSTITNNNINKSNFLGSFNIGSFNQSEPKRKVENPDQHDKSQYFYSFSYGGQGASIKREQKIIDNGILKTVISLDSTFKSFTKGENLCFNNFTVNMINNMSKFNS